MPLNAESKYARAENLRILAREAFATHTLGPPKPHRWELRSPRGFHDCDLVALEQPHAGGAMFLGLFGDPETAVARTREGNRFDALCWVAESNESYLASKVVDGMRIKEAGWVHDSDVARWELWRHREHVEDKEQLRITWDALAELDHTGSVLLTQKVLADSGQFDTDTIAALGVAVAPRVFYLRAAAERCLQLISK